MTDKEIIKALEYCTEGIYICDKDCPCYDLKSDTRTAYCKFELLGDALDLINHQQEKLKIQANNIRAFLKMDDVQVQRIKAEAVEEFAERLKERIADIGNLSVSEYLSVATDIDDLVKEMVGQKNEY